MRARVVAASGCGAESKNTLRFQSYRFAAERDFFFPVTLSTITDSNRKPSLKKLMIPKKRNIFFLELISSLTFKLKKKKTHIFMCYFYFCHQCDLN